MDLGLSDHVILVTGGGSGIGAAVVRLLAEEGATPVILDRDGTAAAAVLAALPRGRSCEVELTDRVALEKTVAACLGEYGRIDGVVNNAGINDSVGLDSSPAAFTRSLEINLVQAFSLVQLTAPALRRSRGSIVNVSSKVATTGQGGTSGYAASKGALNALTREWAVDLVPDGVRVNCVVPAEVMTPMYERWIQTREDPASALAEIAARIPLEGRFTSPEEIASLVVFLLSSRAGHLTGQILHADGGYVHLDRAISPPLSTR